MLINYSKIFGKEVEIEIPVRIKQAKDFVKLLENSDLMVGDTIQLKPSKGANIILKIIK